MAVDTFFGSFISHTYERDDGYSTSWPDYFITNSDFVSSFKMIKCPKLGHSLSDHHPLFANVTLKVLYLIQDKNHVTQISTSLKE